LRTWEELWELNFQTRIAWKFWWMNVLLFSKIGCLSSILSCSIFELYRHWPTPTFRPKDIEILWMNELINIIWMTFILLGLRNIKKDTEVLVDEWTSNLGWVLFIRFSNVNKTRNLQAESYGNFVDEWRNQQNVDDIHPSWSQEQEILKI
jgi:hypothetical protein